MRYARYAATAAAVFILTLAGCTSQQPGNANPNNTATGTTMPETTPPTGESQLPAFGAPPVRTPLNATTFKQYPCKALTQQQAEHLLGTTVTAEPRPDDAEGPACGWAGEAPASDGTVKISFLTTSDSGLSSFYRAKGSSYRFFKELSPVAGYPAVAFGLEDERDEGHCMVAVGTSNHDAFGVAVHQSTRNVGKKNPCTIAHQIAGLVIENIKGAQ